MDIKFIKLIDEFNELIYNSNYSTKFNTFKYVCSGITSENIIHDLPITSQGYVFFGKPKLNLQSSNIKSDRILSCLNTTNPNSLAFYIRCTLDPLLVYSGSPTLKRNASLSPLIRTDLPFIPLLTNMISKLSGWNDPTLEIETTEGGFFSENLSYAKGGEDFTKSINLTAEFKDIYGSPVWSLFTIWWRWIMLSTKGIILPYNKYIEEYKISYSFSIYRFRLDRYGKYIISWSRGIGCFPTSYPISNRADFDINELFTLHNEISIPIQVNFPEHMDPIHLLEFNMWIKRWCPDIEKYKKLHGEEKYYFKHLSVPYIESKDGKHELVWKIHPSINTKTPKEKLKELLENIRKEFK